MSTILHNGAKPQMTVAQMCAHYLPLRVGVQNKAEDKRYAEYWSEQFGSLALDEVTPGALARWRTQRLTEVKPATVNRALAYLKAYFNLAIEDDRCAVNPVSKLDALAEEKTRSRDLKPTEQDALQRCLKPEHYAIVLFALLTGLSRDEQFSLKWSDVDFASSRLQTRGRTVPLHQKACEVLTYLLPQRTTDWVFERKGGPMNAHNFVTRIFRPALEQAGITNFTWQDLRFTCGARLAAAGVAPHVIGKFLGVGVRSVMTSYGHLMGGELESAIDAL